MLCLCRTDVRALSNLKPCPDSDDVKIVGVGYATIVFM